MKDNSKSNSTYKLSLIFTDQIKYNDIFVEKLIESFKIYNLFSNENLKVVDL